jgi:hypothetical protein
MAVVSCFTGLVRIPVWGARPGDPRVSATTFLDDLAADRLDAAYSRTSEGFQMTHSQESLSELLKQHPNLSALCGREGTVITARPCSINPSADSCQVFVENDRMLACLKLLADGSEWKVSGCILQVRR